MFILLAVANAASQFFLHKTQGFLRSSIEREQHYAVMVDDLIGQLNESTNRLRACSGSDRRGQRVSFSQ